MAEATRPLYSKKEKTRTKKNKTKEEKPILKESELEEDLEIICKTYDDVNIHKNISENNIAFEAEEFISHENLDNIPKSISENNIAFEEKEFISHENLDVTIESGDKISTSCRYENESLRQNRGCTVNLYIEATDELNKLRIDSKEFNNIKDLPSSPHVKMKELNISDCVSPNLSKPNHLLVRQRCSEALKILESEILLSPEDTTDFQNPLTLRPYTDIQLLALYNNLQLDEKDTVIESFLEAEKFTVQNQFYDIVFNYLRARTNLNGVEKDIKSHIEDYKKQKESVWTFEERSVTEEGTCEDDQLVSVTCNYEIATYHSNISKHISKQLKQIREAVFDSHTLHIYSAEISKLQVENYLHKVIGSSKEFMNLSKNAPVCCNFGEYSQDMSKNVKELKLCISVLMSFCRRNVKDTVFLRDIKSWLSDSVAILLRVSTSKDHLFILSHLMRCPFGVGDWGAHFIQVLPPFVCTDQALFGSPFLDHLVTVLLIILEPVKDKENFLKNYKCIGNTPELENKDDYSWIVVDSSGEDEEDSTQIWHYFSENDIIQFLNQIPFEDMFKHILLVESDADGGVIYNVEKSTEHSLMKMFAFSTQLLKIFEQGLRTYYLARFKGVVKRLSRLIRHCVHYVSDHWKGFFETWSKKHSKLSVEDRAMIMRLQVEYDEFFENAVKTVFLSPRCGAWQFLAVIPYNCVSLQRLWKIAYQLHIGYEKLDEPEEGRESEDWQSLLCHHDARGQLRDRLAVLGDSESYYLLTALANMVMVRSPKERDFIEIVVSNIFSVTFVEEELRSTLSRTGRDLFLAITGSHPFTVSILLTELQENLNSVGSLALYLFKFLCLDQWFPTEDDLQCLSYWLSYTPPASLENNLARVILSKMNWGFTTEKNSLALPRSIHERVALLIVDVSMKLCSKLGQRNLLSEGVKQVTSVVYAPSPEQVLLKWSWTMLNQLHLHQMDQPDEEVRMLLANQSMVLRGIGDPHVTPSLEPLNNGLSAKNPQSVFAALLMSSWGHSSPEICIHVPENLELMISVGQSDAALTILSLITPIFFNQHEDILSDKRFVNALQCILASDQTYVNLAKSYISSEAKHKIVTEFRGLILNQIFNYKRFNLDDCSPIVKFWVDFLVLVPNWTSNLSVLKLLDTLCQVSLFKPRSIQLLKEIFTEQLKVNREKCVKGGLGGLLTWVSSGTGYIGSLLEKSFASEVPWFALIILTCEMQEEIRCGLWKHILTYLHNNPMSPLEGCLKDVCSRLEIDQISPNNLSLYRLGQQLISLPSNHVAYPSTAQMFLSLHLSRTPPQTGQYDCSSVIYKFYEGFVNGNFLKKIKYSLSDALTFWESELAKEKNNEEVCDETEDKQERRKKRFLTKLVATLSAMSNWLEETRLYETGLYVPALPPQMMPKKLMLVFQEDFELWPELINKCEINKEMEEYIRFWLKVRQCSLQSSPPSSTSTSPTHSGLSDSKEFHHKKSLESLTPAESIIKRLKEYDAPKAPPPLPAVIQKFSRTKSKPINRESIVYDLDRFTDLIVTYSRNVNLKCKEMCAIDCVFVELLPQLWANPITKKVLSAKCKPKRNSETTECSGPASIVVEYSEKRLNEGIKARLDQNRDHYFSLYNTSIQVPSLQVCEAALQLEELVNIVVSWHKSAPVDSEEKKSLIMYGRELFYHFIKLTSEDTNSYPPAKQLITSCADLLGQEFLHSHEDCQESLALQVLQSTSQIAVLLSPHFTPMVTSVETYLAIYASLESSVASHPDLCFMLLSKFEMEAWLRVKKISRNQRSKLVKCICHSLSSIIAMADEGSITCLELYRVHLRAILNYNFPEHFAEVLIRLLEMSTVSPDFGGVRRNIWYDFLNTMALGACEFRPEMNNEEVLEAVKTYSQTQIFISPALVKDTIALLASHFVHQRIEFGLYGLYSKYKADVTPVVILMGMMSFTYILTAPTSSKHTLNELGQEIWTNLEGLWTAWVAPLGGKARASCPQWIQELTLDKSVLLPWTPGSATNPAMAVGMFASTLAYFHNTYSDYRVLSMLLEYYHHTFASSAVKDHILIVVHSQLSSLPWHHLVPTLKDLEIFSKIIDEYLPECHSFIGNIFIQISWEKVVKNSSLPSAASGEIDGDARISKISTEVDGNGLTKSPEAKLYVLLLNILVRVSMEPSVRQSGLLYPLLLSACNFSWNLVDAKNFESVLNWFVMSCDPRIALEMDNRNPIDVSLIRLLYVAAGYGNDPDAPRHNSGTLKRRLLVRGICRLMITAATRHKALLNARKALFGSTFAKIMTHIEVQVVEGLPEESKFEEGFYFSTEALNVIGGGASPPLLQEVCRDHLLEWLKECHPSRAFLLPLVAAISKSILLLHHRSPLIEECIAAIFNYVDSLGEKEVLSWYEIVQVLSFPLTNPTSMLTFAAQENHLLVIYIHTKWRIYVKRVPPSEFLCILGNLMELLSVICPDNNCENWLLLIIGEIIDLINSEVKKEEDYETVWRHSNTLSDLLSCWGEDRSSTGILAAIGLGRRSPLSVRVRLVCKCISTFIKGQLVFPGFFCSINEHKREMTSDSTQPDASCESSLKLLHRLLSLKTNVAYSSYLTGLNYAVDFIQESQNTILDLKTLYDQLLTRVFPKGSAILQLRTNMESAVLQRPADNSNFCTSPRSSLAETSPLPSAPPVDFE